VQVQNLNGHDSKTNAKNEKVWNNRKVLGEKNVFYKIGMMPALLLWPGQCNLKKLES